MWPILTKVQFERLPILFRSKQLWVHIFISLVLNWTIGPFLMLALAWATLPDLPTYRTGVIMVGIARCIAMVMIWNDLARGDADYAAILVVVNAVLQILLYPPLSLLFVNEIGNADDGRLQLDYGNVAISVLIVRHTFALIRPFLPLNHGHLIVPWDPPGRWDCYSICSLENDEQGVLGEEIPPRLLAVGAFGSLIHHPRPIRVPGWQHCIQRPSSLPGLCPPDPIFRHHVDGDFLFHSLPRAHQE